jgi:hypothetical protein
MFKPTLLLGAVLAVSLYSPPLFALPGYEPFADATASGGTSYPVGSKLGFDTVTSGQTNANAFFWAEVNTGSAGNTIGISNVNLSFSSVAGYNSAPNLPATFGNAAAFANISSRSARLGINPPAAANITSGSIYASFLLKITATNGATTGYLVGFNNTPGTQTTQPSVLGAKVGIKAVVGGYQVGTAKSGTTLVYDTGHLYQTGDTLFIVVKYTFGATIPSSLWVNPPATSFGTYTEPTVTLNSTDLTDPSGSPAGIGTWVILQNSTTHGAGYIDEVRFSRTWAGVTAGADIYSQPVARTVNASSNATFTVTAIGDGSLSYQWYKGSTPLTDGGNISGSTTRSLTLNNVAAADAGNFSVIVTNHIGSVTSSVVALTVVDPAIITQPSGQTLPPGATANFSVVATGTAPLTYNWYVNGNALTDGPTGSGSTVSGSATANLSISTISGTDAGNYTCAVTNSLSSGVLSTAAALSIVDPAITSQPSSLTVNYGSNALFNVSVSGTGPFTYQWFKGATPLTDGGNISGSASSSLTVSSASYLDAGTYSVIVTNGNSNTATSSNATLTVKDPVIYAQPVSQIAVAGSPVSYSVSAGGTSLSYTWKRGSTVLNNGGNISGATSPTLNLANVSSADNGSYTVCITNTITLSGVVSSAATLSTVIPPVSRVLNTGSKVMFSVTPSGTSPFTFQWTSNGVPISGATASSYTKSGLQVNDTATYAAQVSNPAGTATGSATLNVLDEVRLYPTNLVVLRQGDGAEAQANTGNSLYLDQLTTNGTYLSSLMLPNTGASALLQSGTASTEGWITLSPDNRLLMVAGYSVPFGYTNVNLGSTPSASVPRGFATVNGLGYYNLVVSSTSLYSGLNPRSAVTDGTNSVWTAASGGNVRYFGPAGTNVVVGATGNTRVVQIFNGDVYYSSAAVPTYGIHKLPGLATANLSDTNIITTGTSSSFPSDFVMDPAGTTVYIAEDAGAGASNTNVPGIQKWTYQPGSSNGVYQYTIPVGASLGVRHFTADFSVNPPMFYAVTCGASNTTAGLNNSIVRVQDNGPSSIPTTIVAAAGANMGYRGIRFGPVVDAPAFLSQPGNSTNATGSTVTFAPRVIGSDPRTYQWYKNGNPLSNGGGVSGATTAVLVLSGISQADAASYSLAVTNELGYAVSSSGTLTVMDGPGISTQPQSQSVVSGQSAQFTVTAAGGGTLTYQWRKNSSSLSDGGNISGATTPTLNLSNASVNDAANYDVVVANAVGSITSSVAVLTVNCPTIIISPANLPGGTVNAAYSQSLSASGGAGGYGFTLSSGTLPPGLTLSGAGALSGTPNTAGSYSFGINALDSNGCTGSTNYSVTIAVPNANPAQLSASVLNDGNFKITVTGSPNMPYTIQGSTNLINWDSLNTNSAPSGTFDYNDLGATNFLQRFYRAVWTP